ncbi:MULTISPECIES: 4-hydroxy-tetrahydrodipicolinate reductase [Vibrio]|jgi:4-hydroxy-tetrahydrodipicolinate reductase|uniref:4-hydroxy-tetrahydrodipicolinate reductase n=1 Tax=Vibrio TaxID=662 RepID=UPI000C83763A|nr:MULTISPECIES: 4-hydroxy-tetrahydrodipicolinate reductase [Vibrio]PMO44896.1 4-hydroxy-tetrahydrodipicolinate reductase [Vibrio sp. 10N.222.52.B12]
MIRVLINGYTGRMGIITKKALLKENGFELVKCTNSQHDLRAEIIRHQPDVVIDFSLASLGYKNTKIILECGSRPVIGTSGFTQAQVDELLVLSKEKALGGLIAPNFSLGAVLMMIYSAKIAKYFPNVEIVEAHSIQKEDSPSGTAIRTAELISSVIHDVGSKQTKIKLSQDVNVHGIKIHSIRMDGFIAKQSVLFGSKGEVLKLTHSTSDRESFMAGVILSCKEVLKRKQLYYGLENFL